jgi:hypothetical protein
MEGDVAAEEQPRHGGGTDWKCRSQYHMSAEAPSSQFTSQLSCRLHGFETSLAGGSQSTTLQANRE